MWLSGLKCGIYFVLCPCTVRCREEEQGVRCASAVFTEKVKHHLVIPIPRRSAIQRTLNPPIVERGTFVRRPWQSDTAVDSLSEILINVYWNGAVSKPNSRPLGSYTQDLILRPDIISFMLYFNCLLYFPAFLTEVRSVIRRRSVHFNGDLAAFTQHIDDLAGSWSNSDLFMCCANYAEVSANGVRCK